MPEPPQQEGPRRLTERILPPGRRLRQYRWLALTVAPVLEIVLVLVVDATDSFIHPLDPVGAGVVLLSVAAAGVGGALAGLGTALVGVAISFVVLADFGNPTAAANAITSAILWCAAATATGLTVDHFRHLVRRRETALERALSRSLTAQDVLRRVLEFSPQLHLEGNLATVAPAICETAVATFGPDSARLYALRGSTLELLALCPQEATIKPGVSFPIEEYPDLEEVLRNRRPSFQRDLRQSALKGTPLQLQRELDIISVIHLPIIGGGGVIGLLSVSWDHLIGKPSGELLAIMQRFADQAAIAWQNALRVEAQEREQELRTTLDRVLALAPSFHISGAREKVAEAICEAAVATFTCGAASLYRVEGDRLCLLSRVPQSGEAKPGLILPLGSEIERLNSTRPIFIADMAGTLGSIHPWARQIADQTGVGSALLIPLRLNERGPRNLLVLSWNEIKERPGESLLVVMQRFADQAALALTNASAAQLHARLEASLLPSAPVALPGLHIATRYRTGERRLSLGGDFLGAIADDQHRLHFTVGDVSGHGPNAAALGATLRSTWRALAMAGHDLTYILTVMTRVLLSERPGDSAFATLVAGTLNLESRKLTLINAGHLPPILATGGEATPLVTSPTPPMGFADPSRYAATDFPLPSDWALLCYTDGLIDARLSPDCNERYGEERLLQRLRSWPVPGLSEEVLDSLMRDVESGNGGPFEDDVAMLLISTDRTADSA
jgi:serine phosphatase RsbU (regulator of sigma subunit)